MSEAPTRSERGWRSYAAARAQRVAETDRWLAGLLGRERDVALVAVGSYGRSELLPGSDLDLLLLHRRRSDIAALADRVWYPVWDSGLRLDHSVRTVPEARAVARSDLKAALGLIHARHVAGGAGLTAELRRCALADWRADAGRRLPELKAMADARAERHGELAFLLEPDLKEARGALRDAHAVHAVAATWIADAPGWRVREAYELLLDTRHALHLVTGRPGDRLVLQEQDAVARALGLLDADTLLRAVATAGRTIAYAADLTWRQVGRYLAPRRGSRRGASVRRPLARDVVEQDGEVVLARGADPARDPVLALRAAAAAAQHGLPLAPAALASLATRSAPMPIPWSAEARDALVALLGAGTAAIPVWEALDQAGLVVRLIPDWERVRNRPQRNRVHRYTVDRHLVETAARAAALTREVARPDLLLAALLHDIGKGWPGDHTRTGEVVARDVGVAVGLGPADVELLARAVRLHLLLPRTAVRRDLDDPVTVRSVAVAVGSRELLDLLFALAVADGHATGPTAWNEWKAGLVAELARRVDAALAGEPPPRPPELTPDQVELARGGGPAVRVAGPTITVVAPDQPGLLWRIGRALDECGLDVRAARVETLGAEAVDVFYVVDEAGRPLTDRARRSAVERAVLGELSADAEEGGNPSGGGAVMDRVDTLDPDLLIPTRPLED